MRISCSASSISVPVFLKSKRLATSRPVWSTAFRTSWRSTSETTSKVGILKRYLQAPQGRYPSGQRGQTVNLLAQPTVVRIHPGPLLLLQELPEATSKPSLTSASGGSGRAGWHLEKARRRRCCGCGGGGATGGIGVAGPG